MEKQGCWDQTLPIRAADPIFLLWLIPNTHGAFGFQDASEIPAHESPVEGWSLDGAFARLGPSLVAINRRAKIVASAAPLPNCPQGQFSAQAILRRPPIDA